MTCIRFTNSVTTFVHRCNFEFLAITCQAPLSVYFDLITDYWRLCTWPQCSIFDHAFSGSWGGAVRLLHSRRSCLDIYQISSIPELELFSQSSCKYLSIGKLPIDHVIKHHVYFMATESLRIFQRNCTLFSPEEFAVLLSSTQQK